MVFNHYKNYVKCNEKQYPVPEYTQDIISFFYFARTIDASKLKEKESFELNFFLSDSVSTIKVTYEGKENVKTKSGTFRCLKFKPMVLTGNVFKDPYPMTIWISDDKNKVPVMLQSAVIVGSIKMELVNYEGLANIPTARIK